MGRIAPGGPVHGARHTDIRRQPTFDEDHGFAVAALDAYVLEL